MFYIELFHYFYYMMPGSKGLIPHELTHRWVKDLRTIPNIFYSFYDKGSLDGNPAFLGYFAGVDFSFVIINRFR